MQGALEAYRKKRNHFRDESCRVYRKASRAVYSGKYRADEFEFHVRIKEKRLSRDMRIETEKAELEKQTKKLRRTASPSSWNWKPAPVRKVHWKNLINEKQEELESRKKQETDISKELEKSQLEGAGITSRKGFIQENLRRIKEELESLTNQKEALFAGMEEGKEEALKKNRKLEKFVRK